jgi:hypothetical protein
MDFTSESTGYASGMGGSIFKTTNGGSNWSLQIAAATKTFFSVSFSNDSVGFILSTDAMLMKTENGGTVSLVNISNIIPHAFSLHQNYPNPFNPVTNIKFDIPKSSYVKLRVYDLMGRELAALVNENLKPGSYQYQWDGSALASGVYFYKLETESFTETKKMLMLK